jgi:outer membrane protein W
MQTQLSVARFYGGCKFNGADYHYQAETDTLIRMDVWKALISSSKEEAAKAAKAEREKWMKVQQSFAAF